jgi:hypothetical protein
MQYVVIPYCGLGWYIHPQYHRIVESGLMLETSFHLMDTTLD